MKVNIIIKTYEGNLVDRQYKLVAVPRIGDHVVINDKQDYKRGIVEAVQWLLPQTVINVICQETS